jgi:endonuclease/exonuclease/phosphatase family metal-dependent hydrolase
VLAFAPALPLALGALTLTSIGVAGLWRHGLTVAPGLLGLQAGFWLAVALWASFLLYGSPLGLGLALAGAMLLLATLPRPAATASTPVRLGAPILVLAVLVLMRAPAVPNSRVPSAGPALTVLSSNVRYGWTDDYRFAPGRHLAWLSSAVDADVIGLQEVNRGFPSGAHGDLLELYRSAIPGAWLYADAHFGFGNALCARLPLRGQDHGRYAAADMLRRSWLCAVLAVGQREISVYVTHWSHLDAPNPVRLAQARELADRLRQESRPWIVLADLNAGPGDPELDLLLDLAHPDFRQRPELLAAPSSPSLTPVARIDHVLCSAHFAIEALEVVDTQGSSDHRPVRARLRLRD